jgi:hypothetical protein
MGLWDRLVGAPPTELLEWVEAPGRDSLVAHHAGARLKVRAALIVRSGQVCVLGSSGAADLLGPGLHSLTAAALPKLAASHIIREGGGTFRADVSFVSVAPQSRVPWATPAPIIARDADNGTIRAKASGEFGFVVSDPVVFLREVVLTGDGTGATRAQLAGLVTSQLGEIFRTGRLDGADLVGPKGRLGLVAGERLAEVLRLSGVTLTRFTVANLTVPPEVRRAHREFVGNSDGYHAEIPPPLFPDEPGPARATPGLPALPAELADILEPPLPRTNGPKSARLPLAENVAEGVFEARKPAPAPKSDRLLLADVAHAGIEAEGSGGVLEPHPAVHTPFARATTAPHTSPPAPAPRVAERPPGPPPIPATLEFHVAVSGAVVGPFDLLTLAAKVREGSVGRKSLVWRTGMDGWEAAEMVVELAPLFPAPPPLPHG